VQVMWCQPQDAVGGRPEEWTELVDARQASTSPSKHCLSVKLKANPGLYITYLLCYFTTPNDCRIECALKCRSCLKT
jgi:hypothetical protein